MAKLHTSPVPSNPSAAELRELSDNFRQIEYSQISGAVYALLVPLPKAEVIQAARDFGVHRQLRSKVAAMDAIVNLITERKGSWDRCQFRGGDE